MKTIEQTNGHVRVPSLSPLENDWMEAIPYKYRVAAWGALTEMRRTIKFNNSFERSKATMAYMDAFVTAIALATDERTDNAKDDRKKEEESSQATSPQGLNKETGDVHLEASGHGAGIDSHENGSDHGPDTY